VIRTRPLLGALVTAAVAAFMLAAYGGSSEGTVVTKTDQDVYDYACPQQRARWRSWRIPGTAAGEGPKQAATRPRG